MDNQQQFQVSGKREYDLFWDGGQTDFDNDPGFPSSVVNMEIEDSDRARARDVLALSSDSFPGHCYEVMFSDTESSGVVLSFSLDGTYITVHMTPFDSDGALSTAITASAECDIAEANVSYDRSSISTYGNQAIISVCSESGSLGMYVLSHVEDATLFMLPDYAHGNQYANGISEELSASGWNLDKLHRGSPKLASVEIENFDLGDITSAAVTEAMDRVSGEIDNDRVCLIWCEADSSGYGEYNENHLSDGYSVAYAVQFIYIDSSISPLSKPVIISGGASPSYEYSILSTIAVSKQLRGVKSVNVYRKILAGTDTPDIEYMLAYAAEVTAIPGDNIDDIGIDGLVVSGWPVNIDPIEITHGTVGLPASYKTATGVYTTVEFNNPVSSYASGWVSNDIKGAGFAVFLPNHYGIYAESVDIRIRPHVVVYPSTVPTNPVIPMYFRLKNVFIAADFSGSEYAQDFTAIAAGLLPDCSCVVTYDVDQFFTVSLENPSASSPTLMPFGLTMTGYVVGSHDYDTLPSSGEVVGHLNIYRYSPLGFGTDAFQGENGGVVSNKQWTSATGTNLILGMFRDSGHAIPLSFTSVVGVAPESVENVEGIVTAFSGGRLFMLGTKESDGEHRSRLSYSEFRKFLFASGNYNDYFAKGGGDAVGIVPMGARMLILLKESAHILDISSGSDLGWSSVQDFDTFGCIGYRSFCDTPAGPAWCGRDDFFLLLNGNPQPVSEKRFADTYREFIASCSSFGVSPVVLYRQDTMQVYTIGIRRDGSDYMPWILVLDIRTGAWHEHYIEEMSAASASAVKRIVKIDYIGSRMIFVCDDGSIFDHSRTYTNIIPSMKIAYDRIIIEDPHRVKKLKRVYVRLNNTGGATKDLDMDAVGDMGGNTSINFDVTPGESEYRLSGSVRGYILSVSISRDAEVNAGGVQGCLPEIRGMGISFKMKGVK